MLPMLPKERVSEVKLNHLKLVKDPNPNMVTRESRKAFKSRISNYDQSKRNMNMSVNESMSFHKENQLI